MRSVQGNKNSLSIRFLLWNTCVCVHPRKVLSNIEFQVIFTFFLMILLTFYNEQVLFKSSLNIKLFLLRTKGGKAFGANNFPRKSSSVQSQH